MSIRRKFRMKDTWEFSQELYFLNRQLTRITCYLSTEIRKSIGIHALAGLLLDPDCVAGTAWRAFGTLYLSFLAIGLFV